MISIYLNIGSNKGDRVANIDHAVTLIMRHHLLGQGRIRRAPLVHSMPVGYASDAEFVNLGLAVDFPGESLPCTPLEILDATQTIEQQIAPNSPHRNPDGTYRDRIVDIDIIAIDGITMETDRLTLPHPRAAARSFVMTPMAFLAPKWHPDASLSHDTHHNKKSIADMGRDSVEAFKMKNKLPLVVVLDNIRSLNNIGSIFRTSDAFRVHHICLCGITATPPAPEIHKTALGAEQSVDWEYYPDTLVAVRTLKKRGYTVCCLEQVHNSVSLENFAVDPSSPYAVVVGNEVSGVDQVVVNACDVCLEIPQEGTKHSLNVAISASIALWHFFVSLRE